ncbi:MAG TPA: FecR family protein [Methylomirabilota bacterium]|nr:FecR family protein [Methylomirabilota bacterium]
MRRWQQGTSLRLVIAAAVSGLLLTAAPASVVAQQVASSAELKRVVGRVEVLTKGQTQWIPAVVGARLAEGDDIRAYSGATAELLLPDTSTVVVAENSRLLLTKMEYDPQAQSRLMLMHLVVGKVRATVAQAAISLARIRQSNFAISTPTAVAAARGTILGVFTDGQQSMMAVEPEFGFTEGTSQGVWRQ